MAETKSPGPFAQRLLICEVSAVLVAGGYLGMCLSAHNRLFMFFGWRDALAVLALVAGGGLAAALLLHALMHVTRGRSDAWLAPWFYFLLVMTAFNFFPKLRQAWVKQMPWLSGTVYYLGVWGLGLALTGAGYLNSRLKQWASAGWRGLAILWPILLILPFSLLTAKRWEQPGEDFSSLGPHTGKDGAGAPVVILILDMIGYEDAFTLGGSVRAELGGLASFAQTAMVFHRARSCGDWTMPSLPGLILQEEVGSPTVDGENVYWPRMDDPSAPAKAARDFPMALPYRFKQAGGRAVYIGYYLPYKELMPGAWDEVFTRCFDGVASKNIHSTWGTRFLHHVVQYLTASKDPIAGIAKQFNLYIPMQNRYSRILNSDILEVSRQYFCQALSPGDLAIIHLPVPHPPFVFDAQGNPSRYGREDPAGYADQLIYADRLFAKLTDELKALGQWDRTWVIMMSDHGSHFKDWSADPAAKRHVPFMVKAPGQTERRDLSEPIRLADFEQIPGFPLAADEKGK